MQTPSGTGADDSPAIVDHGRFSVQLRVGTQADHDEAVNTALLTDLLAGRLPAPSYARYLGQLWQIFQVLDQAHTLLPGRSIAAPFIDAGLARTTAIEQDLAYWADADSARACQPLARTSEYLDRIRTVAATWPGGFVAHHYTQYLGVLNRGSGIRALLEEAWSLERQGVQFYCFPQVTDSGELAARYRESLDALPVDDAEKQAIIGECQRAYGFNTAIYRDIDIERSAATPTKS